MKFNSNKGFGKLTRLYLFWLGVLVFASALAISSIFVSAADQQSGGTIIGATGAIGPNLYGVGGLGSSYSSQYYEPTFQDLYRGYGIDYRTFWPLLEEKGICQERQDFVLEIAPGSCSPDVVRSDLLESQNVPVFCAISAVKVNPLVDINEIKSISFSKVQSTSSGIAWKNKTDKLSKVTEKGVSLSEASQKKVICEVLSVRDIKTSESIPSSEFKSSDCIVYFSGKELKYNNSAWEVKYQYRKSVITNPSVSDNQIAGISFHPIRAAIRSSNTMFSGSSTGNSLPLLSNLGYVVVVLNRQTNESAMPEFVEANLTAHIKYDLVRIFGSGKAEFYLQTFEDEADSESNWKENYVDYGFFKGNAYLRLDELDAGGGGARVSIYKNADERISSFSLRKGELSNLIYLPSSYCSVGFRLRLVGAAVPQKKIKLAVGNDVYWLYKGGKFLDGKCTVGSIDYEESEKDGGKKEFTLKASISCPQKKIILTLTPNENGEFSNMDFSEVKKNYADSTTDEQMSSIKSDFEESVKNAIELADLYPAEKDSNGEYYALNALKQAADKARELKQFETEKILLDKIVSKYAGSFDAVEAENKIKNLVKYNYAGASATTIINYEAYVVRLLDFKNPTEEDATAEIDKDGDGRIAENERFKVDDYVLGTASSDSYVQLKEIEDYKVELEIKAPSISIKNGAKSPGNTISKRVELDIDSSISEFSSDFYFDVSTFGGGVDLKNVKLRKINLKKEARIEVIPEMPIAGSSANFTFRVGIEKRAIEISTEKTQEMIDNINESINKFEDINTRLGEVIKTWKAACFATSTGLMVKNFIANLNGQASARKSVMRGPGGWIEKCNQLVGGEGSKYSSLDDCLYENRDEIGAAVDAWEASEQKYRGALEGYIDKQADKNENTARDNFVNEYFVQEVVRRGNQKVNLGGEERVLYSTTTADNAIFKNENEIKAVSAEDAITILTALDVNNAAGTNNFANGYLDEKLGYYEGDGNSRLVAAEYSNLLGDDAASVVELEVGREVSAPLIESTNEKQKYGLPAGSWALLAVPRESSSVFTNDARKKINDAGVYGKIIAVKTDPNSPDVKPDTTNPQIFILEESGTTLTKGTAVSKEDYERILSSAKIRKIVPVSKSDCENVYLEPTLKYFSSGKNKGLPAVVPLDRKAGWYVGVKQNEGFGSYSEAGQIRTFWICNVGKNGREEFDNPNSDDKQLCTQFNLDTGQPLDQSYCLNSEQTKNIVRRAQIAIKNAGEYDQSKLGGMDLLGFDGRVKVDILSGSDYGTQCQDFMSPEDCNIMFNVCDPVLCPTSRCDLGGTYKVDNVVQSGIIGSVALCLPNIKEGIYVPVCVSGVHAGLEAYLSILRAHRDCLQESLKSGQTVGICDEIKSVYLCELFWRNMMPLLKAGFTNFIGGIFGGGSRGGGEYNNMGQAWDNLDKSINYFTQTYATDSFNAFKVRSTDEIGTEACKMFVSARYPASGEFLDNLLEPESPPQFYAEFDEISYSESTVPPTSQYNVFYHIYAGKDSGVYYTVYLKDPPQSSFYAAQPSIFVKQGYIAADSYADEKKEFTAPSGYKQLCVRINNQEECGFEKVTTSFAIDKLSETYVSDQAKNQNIKTEQECIAGTRDVSSLATNFNLNVGEAAQGLYEPSLYKQGIIRVCAGSNPGDDRKNSISSRWTAVGFCDEQKQITCWLDTKSVRNVIRDTELEKETISAASAELAVLSQQSESQFNQQLQVVEDGISNPKNPEEQNALTLQLNNIEASAPTAAVGARAVWLEFIYFYKKFTGVLSVLAKAEPARPVAAAPAAAQGAEETLVEGAAAVPQGGEAPIGSIKIFGLRTSILDSAYASNINNSNPDIEELNEGSVIGIYDKVLINPVVFNQGIACSKVSYELYKRGSLPRGPSFDLPTLNKITEFSGNFLTASIDKEGTYFVRATCTFNGKNKTVDSVSFKVVYPDFLSGVDPKYSLLTTPSNLVLSVEGIDTNTKKSYSFSFNEPDFENARLYGEFANKNIPLNINHDKYSKIVASFKESYRKFMEEGIEFSFFKDNGANSLILDEFNGEVTVAFDSSSFHSGAYKLDEDNRLFKMLGINFIGVLEWGDVTSEAEGIVADNDASHGDATTEIDPFLIQLRAYLYAYQLGKMAGWTTPAPQPVYNQITSIKLFAERADLPNSGREEVTDERGTVVVNENVHIESVHGCDSIKYTLIQHPNVPGIPDPWGYSVLESNHPVDNNFGAPFIVGAEGYHTLKAECLDSSGDVVNTKKVRFKAVLPSIQNIEIYQGAKEIYNGKIKSAEEALEFKDVAKGYDIQIKLIDATCREVEYTLKKVSYWEDIFIDYNRRDSLEYRNLKQIGNPFEADDNFIIGAEGAHILEVSCISKPDSSSNIFKQGYITPVLIAKEPTLADAQQISPTSSTESITAQHKFEFSNDAKYPVIRVECVKGIDDWIDFRWNDVLGRVQVRVWPNEDKNSEDLWIDKNNFKISRELNLPANKGDLYNFERQMVVRFLSETSEEGLLSQLASLGEAIDEEYSDECYVESFPIPNRDYYSTTEDPESSSDTNSYLQDQLSRFYGDSPRGNYPNKNGDKRLLTLENLQILVDGIKRKLLSLN